MAVNHDVIGSSPIQDVTFLICIWGKKCQNLKDFEHYQKFSISEAVKNAFVFYELKQIGYTKSIFEV